MMLNLLLWESDTCSGSIQMLVTRLQVWQCEELRPVCQGSLD